MKKLDINLYRSEIIKGEKALFEEGNARLCNKLRKKNFETYKKVIERNIYEEKQMLLSLLYDENRYVQSSIADYCLHFNINVKEAEDILEKLANGERDGTLFCFDCQVSLNLYRKGTVW